MCNFQTCQPKTILLTLPIPCISESCIKIKINWNFLFSHFYMVPPKGFMEVFKAFVKPFETPIKKCENENFS